MASILFDCDSTLLKIESLEHLLSPLLSEGQKDSLMQITASGMSGELSFFSSLEKRLEMVAPHLQDIHAFNKLIPTFLSDDAEDLIAALIDSGHHVYLVSGGLKEVIKALAYHLGLEDEKVYAVSLVWDEEGNFNSVNAEDAMSRSKEEGLQEIVSDLERPVIAVGDGMTDARLKDAGIADIFIAYTEHAQRESVMEKADYIVEGMAELGELLEEILC